MTKKDKYVLAKDDDFVVVEPNGKETKTMMMASMMSVDTMTSKITKEFVEEQLKMAGIEPTTELVLQIKKAWETAEDEDFEDDETGYRYIGDAEYVEIPYEINGEPVNSYNNMFRGTRVKGVKSANPNVKYMNNMFESSDANTLDVSELETSGVIAMAGMFANSKATEIVGLNNFDTSNVMTMSAMFYNSAATNLDLRSFDISNLSSMNNMFSNTKLTELHLNNFRDSRGSLGWQEAFSNSSVEVLDLSGLNKPILQYSGTRMFQDSSVKIVYLPFQGFVDYLNMPTTRTIFGVPENTVIKVGGRGYIPAYGPFVTAEEKTDIDVVVPFDTERVEDDRFKIGTEITTREGENGLANEFYALVERKDGSIDRIDIREEITKEPINEIVLVGTSTIDTIEEEVIEEAIPFVVEEIEDEYLAEGITEVFQEGENGVIEYTYEVITHVDGTTERNLIKEEITQEPIPQIVYIGTAEYESIEEIEREEVIPFYTEYVDDDTMYTGEEKVVQEGEDGLMRLLIRVTTFFDGTTQEEILEEEILKEVVPYIIHRGTKLEEDTRIEYEYIDYETEYIETDTLTEGREQVIQGGKRGEIRYVYAIKTLDNDQIEEELVEEYHTEPINRIIYVGTRKAKHWVTEVYLLNERQDREYFVDKSRENPQGLSEEFGITLRERPTIPTAELRHDRQTVTGRLGGLSAEDNYDNVEIDLHFNYIDKGNARETYNKVSNALSKLEPGVTRLRFSDDKDGSFRVLAERPLIQELNNDLLNWGDFIVTLTLKPFRYIEQEEVELTPNVPYTLKQPLKNAQKTAQTVYHQTEARIDITMRKNNERIYTIDEQDAEVVITDANILKTYGGEWR